MIILNIFICLTLIGALCSVFSKNAVYSALFLIFTFFNAAGIFILLNAEFLAMLLVIVYVGAVAVLFLFVIMMIDVDHILYKVKSFGGFFVMFSLAGVLVFEISLIILSWDSNINMNVKYPTKQFSEVANTNFIGSLLYTDYGLVFQLSGIVLLVAIISAIALTLNLSDNVRRQNIFVQNNRKIEDSIEKVKVKTGEGIS